MLFACNEGVIIVELMLLLVCVSDCFSVFHSLEAPLLMLHFALLMMYLISDYKYLSACACALTACLPVMCLYFSVNLAVLPDCILYRSVKHLHFVFVSFLLSLPIAFSFLLLVLPLPQFSDCICYILDLPLT